MQTHVQKIKLNGSDARDWQQEMKKKWKIC